MEEFPFFVKTRRGRIFAIFHKGDKNKPLIILLHGWSGNHLGTWNCFFVKAARYFQREKFNVIRFDFLGSGNSDGEFKNQTISSMIQDTLDIIKYCEESFRFDGKILIGHSQGFFVSLFVQKHLKNLRGMVSWMGRVSNLNEFWSKMYIEALKRRSYFWEDYEVNYNVYLDDLKYNSIEAIEGIKVPVLLIYGEKDTVVFPSEAFKFRKYYHGPKLEIKILEDLDHDFTGNVKEEVLKVTLDFILNL